MAEQMLDVLKIGEVSLRYVNCTGPHTAQRYVQRALWYRGYLPGRTNFLTTVASYKVDMDLYLFLQLTFLQCQPWNTSVVKKAITIWTRRPDCWRIILTHTKQGYLHVRIIPLGNNLTMTYLKKTMIIYPLRQRVFPSEFLELAQYGLFQNFATSAWQYEIIYVQNN